MSPCGTACVPEPGGALDPKQKKKQHTHTHTHTLRERQYDKSFAQNGKYGTPPGTGPLDKSMPCSH
eukprot:5700594-Amphidinium_carterae.1